MLITTVAILVAIVATALLSFARFTHTDAWRATVTPLASIIGSGFLIAGPLLAKDFGGAAILAMAALLLLAYAVGGVVRFNIVHVEDFSATARLHDPILWFGRVTQVVLSLAYSVSVAYYLKLLAEFALKPIGIEGGWHVIAANGLVTAILALLTLLAFGGDLRRVEHVAHGTVSLKIGIIAGLLAALAMWWLTHRGEAEPLPPVRLSLASVPMLLGLLITVQGFETSRYLGHAYPQAMRIRTMGHAQWIASGIYPGFLALLTPFLGRAAQTEGGCRHPRCHGAGRARARRAGAGGGARQPTQRCRCRFNRLRRPNERGVAAAADRPDGVRTRQRAIGGGRVADRPARGGGGVIARVRHLLRAAMRAGGLGGAAVGKRLDHTAGRLCRNRAYLPRRGAGRRAGRVERSGRQAVRVR